MRVPKNDLPQTTAWTGNDPAGLSAITAWTECCHHVHAIVRIFLCFLY